MLGCRCVPRSAAERRERVSALHNDASHDALRQGISFGRKTVLPGGAHGACVWLSDLHGVMRALTRGRSFVLLRPAT